MRKNFRRRFIQAFGKTTEGGNVLVNFLDFSHLPDVVSYVGRGWDDEEVSQTRD